MTSAPVKQPAFHASAVAERLLIGALTALFVARAFVGADDPARLRLTSGGGPLTLNALTLLLFCAWAVWFGLSKRPFRGGPAWIVPAALLLVSAFTFASAAGTDRYQRPGWFVGWDWISLSCLCFLTWQLVSTGAVARGLIAVLLATAVSVSAQAMYQEVAKELGLPSPKGDPVPAPAMELAGDNEFGLAVNQPANPHGSFRATFDQPDTLGGYFLLLLPTAIAWGVLGWRAGRRNRLTILIPLLLLAGVIGAFASWTKDWSKQFEGWQPATAMIKRLPIFGVGPGNFSRQAANELAGPGGYWIGIAATAGSLAALVLAISLVAALALGWRRRDSIAADAPPPQLKTPARWEFYHGGVAGLVLGMIMATGDIPAEADASEMLRLGAVAAGRALLWFGALALLEEVFISSRTLMRSLLPGIVMVAILGIVSDGLDSPALLQPFWLATTIFLTFLSRNRERQPSMPIAWSCVPVAVAIVVANAVHVYIPGIATASAVRSARGASKAFPHAHWKTLGSKDLDHIKFVHDADDFVYSEIVKPLDRALEVDTANSSLRLEKARWLRWHWHYLQELRNDQQARSVAIKLLQLANEAEQVDSHNLGGKLSQFESLILFARPPFAATEAQLASMEKLINQIAQREPTREIALRHRVVLTLLEAKVPKPKIIDDWAVKLLHLDNEASRGGRLTTDQRQRLIETLKKVVQWPSQKLAEMFVGG
jgi:MFS family permease